MSEGGKRLFNISNLYNEGDGAATNTNTKKNRQRNRHDFTKPREKDAKLG